MRLRAFILGAALLIAGAGAASAAELITNGSFEDGSAGLTTNQYAYPGMDVSPGTTGYNNTFQGTGSEAYEVGGWTYYGSALLNLSSAWMGSVSTPFAGEGDKFVALQSTGFVFTKITVAAASDVLFSWLDAGRSQGGGQGNQTYSVGLYDIANSAVIWLGDFSTTSGSAATAKSVAALLAAGDYYFGFLGTNQFGGDNTAFLDRVSANATAVPGPIAGAGLPMLVLGAGALVAMRRRKVA